MPLRSQAFARQKLCLDFVSLKHAYPQGMYVAPVPDEPLLWTGVLFVRKGHYANAVLRFHISFPGNYPDRPPVVTFLQDVFHPLVTPLTTYTYSTRDRGGDTLSAADEEKLPPGGFMLSEGFPRWFTNVAKNGDGGDGEDVEVQQVPPPHIAQVLHYLRLAFSVPELLDNLPLASAANPSAWHAWRSYRAKTLGDRARSPPLKSMDGSDASSERNLSPRTTLTQQPGGAKRPGEWNWTGVWEERVRKVVVGSRGESALFGREGSDVIGFAQMDDEALRSIAPQMEAQVSILSEQPSHV